MIKALLEIVIGLVFIVLAILLLTYKNWLMAFITVIQGGIVGILFLIGIAVLLLGLSEIQQ